MTPEAFRRGVFWFAWLTVATYVLLAAWSGTLLQPVSVLDIDTPGTLARRGAAVLGLLMVISFPGLLLSLAIPAPDTRHPADILLEALALSAGGHILNLSIAKIAGMPITPGLLVAMGLIEVGVAWTVAWRRNRFARVEPPSRAGWIGLVAAAALPIYLVANNASFLMRDLGDYFYEAPPPEETSAARQEIAGVRIERSTHWRPVQAFEHRLMRIDAMTEPETLVLHSSQFQEVTLRFLWQGPVGSRLVVDCEDIREVARVERAPVELEDEGPTLRYLDSGIDSVVIRIPVRSSRRCILTPQIAAGQHGTIVDLSGCPSEVLYATAALGGWKPIHYYQILNIAENVAWARALFDTLWTTKNQPPLWSYVYSSVNLYVGDGLWAIDLFFFLLVGLTVYLAWAIILVDRPYASPWLLAPVILVGISHARIMVEPGSTNFPDNLYALAILASLYLLLRRRCAAFATAGVATTLLRYSGSGAVALMGALAAWYQKPQRRRFLVCTASWVLAMTAVSAGFLVAGLLEGSLRSWLDILYFETFPEHFHGNYDLGALLARPPVFYWSLLKVTGLLPLTWLFLRGATPKLVATLTIGYTAMLCMVDHFPSHYFVPPMYLVAIASTGTLAALHGWKRWVLLAICLGGLFWGLRQPL